MLFKAENLRLIIETCRTVVHYHSELQRIFIAANVPSEILQSVPPPLNPEWGQTKREVADHVVMSLAALPDGGGIGPLRQIVSQLTEWRNFASAKDPDHARALVRQLNAEVGAQKDRREREAPERRQMLAMNELVAGSSGTQYFSQVGGLRDRFIELTTLPDPQRRGYEFQSLLYDLLKLGGLQPGKSFRVTGEEIDGSFVLDFQNYLLEARWQKELVDQQDLLAFAGKVDHRIECTRGVFVAVNGFSMNGITAFQRSRPSIVLMDGAHLMATLEGHIHIRDLLRGVLAAASTTGTIYTPAAQLSRA